MNQLQKGLAAALCICMGLTALPAGDRGLASAEVTPNPVISRNVPAYAGVNSGSAYAACNENYGDFWTVNGADYLAYDLSGVEEEDRTQVLAVLYSDPWNPYDGTVSINGRVTNTSIPLAYTVEVNAAEGGTYPEEGWEIVETVEDNLVHSRQHLVNLEGYNWIRLNISETRNNVSLNFDIHNCADGVTDSWIFFGDSITQGGMRVAGTEGGAGTFAEEINGLNSDYFPVAECGGIGGVLSTQGRDNIDRWLETFPGQYVSLAYGTNDAWGNQTGTQVYYDNLAYMVEAILEAGKTPIIPKIPYSTNASVYANLADYNAMVDAIYEAYPAVIQGPDFYAMFEADPSLLSGDGVHPNSDGYAAMRKLWAETMYEAVYSAESSVLKGDVDGNGVVNQHDASLLSAWLVANPDAELSFENGPQNADMNDDGILNGYDLSYLKKAILAQ